MKKIFRCNYSHYLEESGLQNVINLVSKIAILEIIDFLKMLHKSFLCATLRLDFLILSMGIKFSLRDTFSTKIFSKSSIVIYIFWIISLILTIYEKRKKTGEKNA